MMTRGRTKLLRRCALRMKCPSIFSAASKSAITPSRIGRIAVMLPGVRPIISLASVPTASICAFTVLTATIDGSLRTMPWPRANTQVLAVPRSIARSFEKNDIALSSTPGLLGRFGGSQHTDVGDSARRVPALVQRCSAYFGADLPVTARLCTLICRFRRRKSDSEGRFRNCWIRQGAVSAARAAMRSPWRARLERRRSPLRVSRLLRAHVRRQNALAQTDALWGDFDEFVVVDELDGLFEAQAARWDQPDRLVRARRAHVRLLLFLRD